MPLPPEIQDWLDKFGINSKSWRRIRFGGVVGKVALIAIFVAGGLALVAARTSNATVLELCVGGLVLDGLFAIGVIAFHGHKHPAEATLEGTELVAWQHVQHEYAAKDVEQIPQSPPVLEGLGTKPIETTSIEGSQEKLLNPGESS